MTHPLANFLAFQLCWLACILGAAAGYPLLGPVCVAVWLALHLRATGSARTLELKLVVAAAALGYVADSALVLLGLLSFPEPAMLGGPSSLWMIALWMAFAATLRHALRWLRGRYGVAGALGAVFGPIAYWGGAELGAVSLPGGTRLLLAVAVEWGIAMPLLLLVVARGERTQSTAGGAVLHGE